MSAPIFASTLQRPAPSLRAGPGEDDDDETPIGDPDDDEDYEDDEEEDDEEDDEDDTLWAWTPAPLPSAARAAMR